MQNRQEQITEELKDLMKSTNSDGWISDDRVRELEHELIALIDLEKFSKVEVLEKISELTQ